ncbi:MvdC/MvdD family ATP grasp protein [Actinoallomurus sp. NPDC052308]|uniref:MvdC/MvdD family ATP grasp protein n=1 Tax=Actinoallomurus sp. NPDC052308 TaxID=3155530 RepID=UPI00344A5060
MRPLVLVITERCDLTADRVIDRLRARGIATARVDYGDFPAQAVMSARLHEERWCGELVADGLSLRIDEVTAAYYRKPSRVRPAAPPGRAARGEAVPGGGAAEYAEEFAAIETRHGFVGVIEALDCRWLNHPAAIRAAEWKPSQLRTADRAGLAVPRTLITNDPEEGRRFVRSIGGFAVYKTMAAHTYQGSADGPQTVYATVVSAEDIDDSVSGAAHLFQEPVVKRSEARITVVGHQVFGTEIIARSEAARADWRSDYGRLDYRPIEVPSSVRSGLLRTTASYGLSFCSADFALTEAGEWVFLDLNPNGQWAWLEAVSPDDGCGPVTAAIADLLAGC